MKGFLAGLRNNVVKIKQQRALLMKKRWKRHKVQRQRKTVEECWVQVLTRMLTIFYLALLTVGV